MDTDREIERATEIGKANQETIRLARNFCGSLKGTGYFYTLQVLTNESH